MVIRQNISTTQGKQLIFAFIFGIWHMIHKIVHKNDLVMTQFLSFWHTRSKTLAWWCLCSILCAPDRGKLYHTYNMFML
jgi:hypothetical protein